MAEYMEKQEFLDKLRLSLNGRVDQEIIRDTISYYEEYINTQTRLGHPMSEVMSGLGDPRLIAKTTLDIHGNQQEPGSNGYREAGTSGSGRTYDDTDSGTASGGWKQKLMTFAAKVPSVVWMVLFLILLFGFLSILFRAFIALAPFILIAAVVYMVYRFIRDIT